MQVIIKYLLAVLPYFSTIPFLLFVNDDECVANGQELLRLHFDSLKSIPDVII
jgi:hypothetical protein